MSEKTTKGRAPALITEDVYAPIAYTNRSIYIL